MAEIAEDLAGATAKLFNSPLETGLRAVFILEAVYPLTIDLSRLTWLDHLVVHTGDINGPQSLHVPVPGRNGELLVRRRLIEESLTLMRRLHLVEAVAEASGVAYRASDEAPALIMLMRSKYSTELKKRAEWLVTHIDIDHPAMMAKLINPSINRWFVEFLDDV
ncbi:MAG: threonine transporter [Phaeospirillum sp.]|nr:threonine transporter [Phaeospirillum sp.]